MAKNTFLRPNLEKRYQQALPAKNSIKNKTEDYKKAFPDKKFQIKIDKKDNEQSTSFPQKIQIKQGRKSFFPPKILLVNESEMNSFFEDNFWGQSKRR